MADPNNQSDGDALLGKPPPYHPEAPPAYQSYADNPPPYYSAPPPAGWVNGQPPPPPNYTYGTNYGSTVILEPVTVPATHVIIVGGCPACRVGVLEDNFSCLGLLCAILFFPLGILCCLALRDRRCTNCGAVF